MCLLEIENAKSESLTKTVSSYQEHCSVLPPCQYSSCSTHTDSTLPEKMLDYCSTLLSGRGLVNKVLNINQCLGTCPNPASPVGRSSPPATYLDLAI